MNKNKDLVNIYNAYTDNHQPRSNKITETKINESCNEVSGEENIDMAKSEVFSIIKTSNDLMNLLANSQKMEPWMLSKLVKANDYISSVKSVLEYEDFENYCAQSQEDIADVNDGIMVVSKIKDMLAGEDMAVNEQVLKQIIFNIECLKS
jgi:hypothetical protein